MSTNMHRRHFFGTSAAAAAAAAAAGNIFSGVPCKAASRESAQDNAPITPAILTTYTNTDHRQRLENIRICHENIQGCMRKHLITDYLPGQCYYNLGEFLCTNPRGNPDELDEQELDRLQQHGIEVIQVHDEWNNALRLPNADKTTPLHPAGFRRFIDMVHKRGMKLLVYVSTGFIDRRSPDFRPEWARTKDLVQIYWKCARCSPASSGWRAHVLPHLTQILDDYGVDGLFNDTGYIRLAGNPKPPTSNEVLAFDEGAKADGTKVDGAISDLLGLVYAEVKRRGGIMKLHCKPLFGRPLMELKLYDYLFTGECVKKGDTLREATKNSVPYVVPCLDMSVAKIENEDELYLHTIPYMQFPLLLAGRPFTGQRATVPGVEYKDCFWTRHCRAIWKYYQEHPEGPHTYAWWDSVPGRPEARPTHARWLKQYRPLVEEGTWAWLEVNDSKLFTQPLPRDVVASVFANRHLYIVLANYGRTPATIQSTIECSSLFPKEGSPTTHWDIPARSLVILQRTVS